MTGVMPDEVRAALDAIAGDRFLITSAFEARREGTICSWVQPCAHAPSLVCAAVRRGHPIEPLIRDSHVFALCRIEPDDRRTARAFGSSRSGDPFDGIEVERLRTGAPILRRAMLALDCEVYRHFDLEADHELYIGLVVGTRQQQRRERER
ncbi:MAG: flavin reductase [Phycisphaerae bacterium]|nr:flavin reductase [Phycisphaerae bacterium]